MGHRRVGFGGRGGGHVCFALRLRGAVRRRFPRRIGREGQLGVRLGAGRRRLGGRSGVGGRDRRRCGGDFSDGARHRRCLRGGGPRVAQGGHSGQRLDRLPQLLHQGGHQGAERRRWHGASSQPSRARYSHQRRHQLGRWRPSAGLGVCRCDVLPGPVRGARRNAHARDDLCASARRQAVAGGHRGRQRGIGGALRRAFDWHGIGILIGWRHGGVRGRRRWRRADRLCGLVRLGGGVGGGTVAAFHAGAERDPARRRCSGGSGSSAQYRRRRDRSHRVYWHRPRLPAVAG